jgi:hypothetical protein
LFCLDFNILLKAQHIPGRLNSVADSLSRGEFQKFDTATTMGNNSKNVIPVMIPVYNQDWGQLACAHFPLK